MFLQYAVESLSRLRARRASDLGQAVVTVLQNIIFASLEKRHCSRRLFRHGHQDPCLEPNDWGTRGRNAVE